MRTAIKQTDVYSFSELSDKAKEKAREWYREGGFDYDWYEGVYESISTAANLLGIELATKGKASPCIYFSGFYCQGSGSSFEGTYRYKKGSVRAIKAEFPTRTDLHAIALGLQNSQSICFYRAIAGISSGRQSNCIRVNVECESLHYSDYLQTVEKELTYWLEAFNAWIYSSLEKEYEYLNSNECIEDALMANDYEFTEEGVIY